VGLASWYGKHHQGRKTASGERFSRGQLTAAHRSLPLGTKVKVTNLRTKQQVVVKITDRGPYGAGKRRIIDLSEAAAKRVGLLEHGTERVEVVVVENAS
jgi:rare lipoprotein A